MALGHTPTNAQLRRRFQRGLQILLDTFHDAILLSTQDIQVVNFSNIYRGFVNVIQGYKYRYPGGYQQKYRSHQPSWRREKRPQPRARQPRQVTPPQHKSLWG